MAFFLGIDGGGTKTTCAVGDEARVLGTATAGGSNIVRVGEAAARRNLHAAIQQACAAAQVSPAQIGRACIGVAGVSATDVSERVHGIVAELVGGPTEVVGDMEIAAEAAFGGGPGVIVNAGTGSFAFGRNERGETARAGGWGFAISDEGSAHWIGRMAVSACLRACDAGEHPALLLKILSAWHAATRDDLVRIANASPPPNFAELFPPVLSVAEAGDALATEILTEAGMQLARLVGLVLPRLRLRQAANIGMVGGVFHSAASVRAAFLNALGTAGSEVSVIPEVVDPVLGALTRARNALRQAHEGPY